MWHHLDDERRVRGLLAIGFLLIILLLLADGVVGFRSIRSIQSTAAELVEDQFLHMALIDEAQREQGSLSAVFYRLAGDPDSLDRSQILEQIDATEHNIRRLVARVPPEDPDRPAWDRLASALAAFSAETRRLLVLDHPPTLQSRELLRQHQEVISAVGKLIHLSHRKARAAKHQIEVLAGSQMRKDTLLLGGSLLLAFVCVALVLRTA